MKKGLLAAAVLFYSLPSLPALAHVHPGQAVGALLQLWDGQLDLAVAAAAGREDRLEAL